MVTNKVITIVGTNANKNLPMITLTGDAFQAERASSSVPKYKIKKGNAVHNIAGNATNNSPQKYLTNHFIISIT